MITYGQLRELNTGHLGSAGEDYATAGTKLRAAGTGYATDVVRPVDAAQIWSGNGRGHAETVVRVERKAFSTAAARMRTVGTTLETLQSQLAAAKKTATSIAAEAKAKNFKVDEETGQISRKPTPMLDSPYDGGAGNPVDEENAKAARLDERMRAALRRARRADKTCSQLLDTVIGGEFVSTATAQPGVLQRAKDAQVEAEGGELYALLLGDILDTAYKQDLKHAKDMDYTYADFVLSVGKGFWDALRSDASSIWNLGILLGLAASGNKTAQDTLQRMPADIRRQLTTKEGWKELTNLDSIDEGHPGEFAGNLLYMVALRKLKLPKITRGRHGVMETKEGQQAAARAFKPPKVYVDRHGRATNGTYAINEQQSKHTSGKTDDGKSQFFYRVDDKQATLDAAVFADKHDLWDRGKAKVYVENGPIGVNSKGEPTHWINVYRTSGGTVHGTPGGPP